VAYRLQPRLVPARNNPAVMVRIVSSLIALLVLLVLAAAIPADAQGRGRGLGRFGAPPPSGRGYEEPAFARGYADGFRHAQDDRRERRRYDPVAHRDYRDATQGFSRSYGTLEAYKNNYRAGFRAGYDAGYRDDTSRRK
jgi:hypothetical protein